MPTLTQDDANDVNDDKALLLGFLAFIQNELKTNCVNSLSKYIFDVIIMIYLVPSRTNFECKKEF